ncbi:hypothetical protein [Amycolatopsis sp. cmx-4-61]
MSLAELRRLADTDGLEVVEAVVHRLRIKLATWARRRGAVN